MIARAFIAFALGVGFAVVMIACVVVPLAIVYRFMFGWEDDAPDNNSRHE